MLNITGILQYDVKILEKLCKQNTCNLLPPPVDHLTTLSGGTKKTAKNLSGKQVSQPVFEPK
jgi:hypothetical protein